MSPRQGTKSPKGDTAKAKHNMNKPYLYQAGYSLDTVEAGKCQIRTTDIRGNTVKLSGWFKNDKTAQKELIRRQREFGSAYGCR
jgi:hypothetical protein